MKNKKGFTLIELLAVIVILAIIALIAVPIVLNMIAKARKNAAKSSALGYIDSIEYYSGFNQISEDAGITGYSVPLPTMTNGSVTCTKTTSGWDNECSAFFDAVDDKSKGDKPKTATIVISSTGKVLGGTTMKYGKYDVNYDGSTATVGGSSSSSNNGGGTVPEPNSFATDSWATIAANTSSSVYHVGDEKEVEIDTDNDGNKESYTVRIANNTTPSVCGTEGYSQTACGFVVEFVDVVERKQVNNTLTNVGGWKESILVSYLNDEFYSKLPVALQNVIIPTYPIVSGAGYGNNQEGGGISEDITSDDTTKNKIYLLSAREIGIDLSTDSKKDILTDTRVLDYYSINNSYKNRIKDKKYWILRTANSNNNERFVCVSTGGGADSNCATLTAWITPAFRIGTN